MICCFFGHADTPQSVRPVLMRTLIDLIENRGASTFYVGTRGSFDRMALSVTRSLCHRYPGIDYRVMLAYPNTPTACDALHTVYPAELEDVPAKFAISHCNRWMVRHTDLVIAYVIGTAGGAAQSLRYARSLGKPIINLADAPEIRV